MRPYGGRGRRSGAALIRGVIAVGAPLAGGSSPRPQPEGWGIGIGGCRALQGAVLNPSGWSANRPYALGTFLDTGNLGCYNCRHSSREGQRRGRGIVEALPCSPAERDPDCRSASGQRAGAKLGARQQKASNSPQSRQGEQGVAPDGWRPLARLESSPPEAGGRRVAPSRPSGIPLGRDFRLAGWNSDGPGNKGGTADDPVPLGAGFRFNRLEGDYDGHFRWATTQR